MNAANYLSSLSAEMFRRTPGSLLRWFRFDEREIVFIKSFGYS